MNLAPGSNMGSGYRTRHVQGLKPPQTRSPSYATGVDKVSQRMSLNGTSSASKNPGRFIDKVRFIGYNKQKLFSSIRLLFSKNSFRQSYLYSNKAETRAMANNSLDN